MRRSAAVLLAGLIAPISGCAFFEDDPPPPAPAEVIAPMPVIAVAEPPPPPPPPPSPPPAPPDRFAGHIASFANQAAAQTGLERLRKTHPTLTDLAVKIIEVDLGGQRGKVLRLLVGGFPDRAGAREFCRKLRAEKLYCAPHDLPSTL